MPSRNSLPSPFSSSQQAATAPATAQARMMEMTIQPNTIMKHQGAARGKAVGLAIVSQSTTDVNHSGTCLGRLSRVQRREQLVYAFLGVAKEHHAAWDC